MYTMYIIYSYTNYFLIRKAPRIFIGFLCGLFVGMVACATDTSAVIREGCLESNVVRIVVFIPNVEVRNISSEKLAYVAVQQAEQRCIHIIKYARQFRGIQSEQEMPLPLIKEKKFIKCEKLYRGYRCAVDCTLEKEAAILLSCQQ